jgi:acyl-CoA synthetase (AMP-forming)/AMP-acid ligase II/thioesterase domain-containing protein/acyl carrier protein
MSVSQESIVPAFVDPEGGRSHLQAVAGLLESAAREHPSHGVRFVYGDREGDSELVTHPALLDEALRILGSLRRYDRPAGAKVALLLDRPRDFIPAFWACVLGGYVPCPLTPIRNDPERWAKHLAHVDSLLDRPLFVSTDSLAEEVAGELPVAAMNSLRNGPPCGAIHQAESDAAAVLVLTSGSTGNSKAVVLTHANLLASMRGKMERQQLSAADVTLNWISFDHVAALLEIHLVSMYVGATQLHADAAAIIADPPLFLRLIDRYRVNVTFSPNFLFGQINSALESAARVPDAPPVALELSCMRHIVSGGEANVVETGRRFLELLAPFGLARSAVRPAFGMTETCAGSIYSSEFPHGDSGREFACVGRPISGLQMRIVDDHGAVCEPGESGELQLRGPMIFGRYYNNPGATRAAFTDDGWFRTGDLGRIEDGRLSLVGRSKDSIIVSGVNYFSHELETVLDQLEGVERSFVAAFPTRPKGADTEQLVVSFGASFPLDDETRLHRLAVAVRNTTILLWGFRPALILPLPKEAFPKTSLGKIQRALLRKRLEAGELADHVAHICEVTRRQLGGYTQPEGTVETTIAEIYAGLFGLEAAIVSSTASFFDLGGTSLDILKLTQTLAQRFGGIDVSVAAILQSPTVRTLAARVAPSAVEARREYDPIVALQLTGHKPPLFCVHPGIGEVLVFVSLAKYFVNERPFFALRARGFDAGEPCFTSLEEMVRTYVAAVRKRQPHGPYALAGYSLGGPIAVEMARTLESQGEQVAFLGCIDGPPCDMVEPLDATETAVSLAFFLSLIDRRQLQELPGRLRNTGEDACAYLVHNAPRERLQELNLDLPKFKAWSNLSQSLNILGASYVNRSGTQDVESVTVFYAEPLRYTKEDWVNRLKHWDCFARGENRYIEVAGDHASLLGPKHVGSFQAVLRAQIDRAMGASRRRS